MTSVTHTLACMPRFIKICWQQAIVTITIKNNDMNDNICFSQQIRVTDDSTDKTENIDNVCYHQ